MSEKIPQTCPACSGSFTASKLKTKCPHCGVMTELGIHGKASFAFVTPKPANGTSFTVTDLINEFSAPHITGPGTSDMRGLIKILKTVSINDICPETGMTPLIWAIKNNRHVAFCFVHGAEASKRGMGDFDITPIELAIQCKNDELVETLIRYGAKAPADALTRIAQNQDSKNNEFLAKEKFVRDTVSKFKTETKSKKYVQHVEQLENTLGVKSSTARGRGIKAFNKVPLRSLAEANQATETNYFVSLHESSYREGFTLFCERGFEVSKSVRLLLAPTVHIDEVVAVTNLMSPDEATLERLEIGSQLVKLNEDFPFLLLECGRDGVTGQFRQIPSDTTDLVVRLLEICPHYGNNLLAGSGKPWENVDESTAVSKELNNTSGFHFNWD